MLDLDCVGSSTTRWCSDFTRLGHHCYPSVILSLVLHRGMREACCFTQERTTPLRSDVGRTAWRTATRELAEFATENTPVNEGDVTADHDEMVSVGNSTGTLHHYRRACCRGGLRHQLCSTLPVEGHGCCAFESRSGRKLGSPESVHRFSEILMREVREYPSVFDASGLGIVIPSTSFEEARHSATSRGRFEHDHCHRERSVRLLLTDWFFVSDWGTGSEMLSTVCILVGPRTGLALVIRHHSMCNIFGGKSVSDETVLNSQSKC